MDNSPIEKRKGVTGGEAGGTLGWQMNRDAMDGWCERGILGLVLAILVFAPLATGAVLESQFLVVEALTVGVMLLWGARLWLKPKARFYWPPICWAVLAFAAYAVARYLTADIEYVARQEMLQVLVYAALFLAILNNLHRQEMPQIISFVLLFVGLSLSCYAVFQFLTGSDKAWWFIRGAGHRGSGTYISPDHLAGFLEQLLPLGLAYTVAGRIKPVTRILIGYASLVMVAGIAVTLSRGGWISTGVALVGFFGVLILNRTYRLPSILLLVALVGAGSYFLPKSLRFGHRARIVADGKIDDDLRFALWAPAVRIWEENLWWGAGPGHFDYRFRAYRPEDVQARPDRAHNDYLNTLADWGLAGAGLVACAWVLLAMGAARTWRSLAKSRDLGGRRSSNKYAFVLGALLGLLALLCHSMVDFNLHIPANALLAVALMALLSSHLRFATERYWTTAGVGLKALGSAVLAGGMVYLGMQGWRQAGESRWLSRAWRAPNFSPAQVDCLKQAFAVEPMNHETAYAIGEACRVESQYASEYRELAEEAKTWFARAAKLDRWDDASYLRYGWCVDWLGHPGESGPYFSKALELDPNGYYTAASVGLHYVELGDYAAAKACFERSLRLEGQANPIAQSYLKITEGRLREAATNEVSAQIGAAGE